MTDRPRPPRPWDKTPPAERGYFETLGPGLVAVLPPRPSQESGEEWRPPTGGAWVHVGADGRVLGFTGKAEVGQGTRPALTLIVAEELRVPIGSVELVMADTDLCPWDIGTFGSRSMPDAAPALAAAAAGAREALLELASERLARSPTELEAANGEIRPHGAATGLSYGELARGAQRVVAVRPGIELTARERWTPVGHPSVDLDAMAVVTGRRQFVSDLRRPAMAYGAVLHPPSYGASLVEADVQAVRRGPGIHVVQEGDFVGVVADRPSEARAALAEVRATWRPRAQPGERDVERFLRTHPKEGDSWDAEQSASGDVDAALAKAPVTLSATYRTAYIAHVPLETHCASAEWHGRRLTVWVGTQTPFRVRGQVAKALGIAEEDVRVIVPPTGSGFGGKHGADIATWAARLARSAGRPVQVAFSREEEFRFAYFRPMAIIDVKAAAEKDGRLVAWQFHNVNAGSAALSPPYRIPSQKVDNELSESPLPQGSYRALAATTNNFARESAIDEIAHLAGVDPLTMREANLADERLKVVLRKAAARLGWAERPQRERRGYGLAVGLEKGSRVASGAEVTVDEEERLTVDRLVTVFEAGAVVHPDNLRSQVEGAAVMALGGALYEEVRFDAGVVTNPRLSAYRVPRFSDLPRIEVELVNRPDLPAAGGGETPMIAIAPAIANAVFEATGRRIRALPLAPGGRLAAASAGQPAPASP